jgi:hypothetical protein
MTPEMARRCLADVIASWPTGQDERGVRRVKQRLPRLRRFYSRKAAKRLLTSKRPIASIIGMS